MFQIECSEGGCGHRPAMALARSSGGTSADASCARPGASMAVEGSDAATKAVGIVRRHAAERRAGAIKAQENWASLRGLRPTQPHRKARRRGRRPTKRGLTQTATPQMRQAAASWPRRSMPKAAITSAGSSAEPNAQPAAPRITPPSEGSRASNMRRSAST